MFPLKEIGLIWLAGDVRADGQAAFSAEPISSPNLGFGLDVGHSILFRFGGAKLY